MLGLFVQSSVIDNQSPFTLLLIWNDEGRACSLTIGGFNPTTLNKFHQEHLYCFRSFPLELISSLTIDFRVFFQLDLGRTKFPAIQRILAGNTTK